MIENGVIGSWVPQPDPANFGFPVVAFCSVTITQEIGHDAIIQSLSAIPEIIEVHTVTGNSDLMVRIAARSNPDMQRVLDAMIATKSVVRCSSVIVLNSHIQGRTLPLMEAAAKSV
ncbi:Lrp/AsnC family transcriptional regulator for asnA, asnC and gidA [Arthrobacter sp. 1088]|jgi:Lrp/AsnC family transcriptional regulator for asnA, asnC and gidA|nr:Lrp/AsnC family transcriptional regulator for asnA, asnC and gidA [Arthrobacter sp. 1088]